uniref:Uncharacterized protein n=1 Tax=Leersia perrieri TaxID=77586 RepID=A0A0D9WHW8_9ORYZ
MGARAFLHVPTKKEQRGVNLGNEEKKKKKLSAVVSWINGAKWTTKQKGMATPKSQHTQQPRHLRSN